MSDANRKLVWEHYEQLINRKNLAAAELHLAPDFIDHAAPPGTPRGPEAARQAMARLHNALPDVWVRLEDMVSDGDRVAVRVVWRGTHLGSFLGRAPTGRKVTINGMVFWRVANGRLAERWANIDLRELGPETTGCSPETSARQGGHSVARGPSREVAGAPFP